MKKILKDLFSIELIIWVSLIMIAANLDFNSNITTKIEELQRSHAMLEGRQERLRMITCGYCHDDSIPEGWGRHEKNITG